MVDAAKLSNANIGHTDLFCMPFADHGSKTISVVLQTSIILATGVKLKQVETTNS